MFEKATKMKLRFAYKGVVSVEDLWDLSLVALDMIYKKLMKAKRETNEDSLLDAVSNTVSKTRALLNLQLDIVKHIVGVKLQEKADRDARIEKKAKKQMLLSLIADKQNEALKDMPVDDLIKMVDEL